MNNSIATNISQLQRRIKTACINAGRNPEEITIVAVSKTHPYQDIAQAVSAGIKHIGENRIQEAEAKFDSLTKTYPELTFTRHLVGHLQTNKVRRALEIFDLIQSLDSLKLAHSISSHARELNKEVEVLIQVNTSGEASKFGIEPNETLNFVHSLSELDNLKIKGLMTIGAFSADPEVVRPGFARLRHLFEHISGLNMKNVEMKYLSMGMTDDFELAIAEGANTLRIGSAIFGPRTALVDE
jgi:pyridoxal phosphate enzyme (YggS family)